ncbi:MAG: hypothetical protein JWP89_1939 [Schlesneria sp.]|nr:hypothetical protein [Schlesneria sp.]
MILPKADLSAAFLRSDLIVSETAHGLKALICGCNAASLINSDRLDGGIQAGSNYGWIHQVLRYKDVIPLTGTI